MRKKKELRWRQELEERRKGNTAKAIRSILIAIFLILLLGISWRIYSAFRHSVWDSKNRLNLVLNVSPISIVSFDPHSQTINVLTIPDGTYIETAGDFGPYRIEKIYPLGELENKGVELLSTSLESYFGLPIDGWLTARIRVEETKPKQFLSELIVLAIKDRYLSNLSRYDLARLWLMTKQTKAHKIKIVDLGKTTVAEDFKLPDGTWAKKIDEQRISLIINNLFSDSRIRQEDLAIAIMNGGAKAGLATKAARLVGNIGGRLVEVGDWPEKLESCQVKAIPEAKKSYTCQKLLKVFDCHYQEDLEKDSRWDLVVILARDSW